MWFRLRIITFEFPQRRNQVEGNSEKAKCHHNNFAGVVGLVIEPTSSIGTGFLNRRWFG